MKSWRKLLCLFLAMVMCLSLLPLSAFAAEEDEQLPEEELIDALNEDLAEETPEEESGDVPDEPEETPTEEPEDIPTDEPEEAADEEAEEMGITSIVDSGTCGSNSTWTLDNEGKLTISGTGAVNGFQNNSSIKTVVIEEGITGIGNEAFYCSDQITSVTMPSSLTSIGYGAFQACTSLTNITTPQNGLITIGGNAFWSCSNLRGFSFPNSVSSIGATAFGFCRGLTSITLPSNVVSIGERAFMECSNLKEISFTGDAPSIGESCFTGVTATAYYPADNDTWTETVLQNYGGNITWIVKGATGIEINEINFPDPVFREYVSNGIDEDHDNYLSVDELDGVAVIRVPYSEEESIGKIGSLKGIEFFHNLEILICSENNLESLDMSSCDRLRILDCGENLLSNLNVSENVELEELRCCNNRLTELDVSNNIKLENLWCHGNILKNLDVSQCPVIVKMLHKTTKPTIGSDQWSKDYYVYQMDRIEGNWYEFTVDNAVYVFPDLIRMKNYNSFRHNYMGANVGFANIKNYKIDEEYERVLFKSFTDGEIGELKKKMKADFFGACIGISSTIALTFMDLLEVDDISSKGAECYFDMGKPSADPKLLNSIMFYQLLNNYKKDKYLIEKVSSPGVLNSVDCSLFLSSLVENALSDSVLKRTMVFGFCCYFGGKVHSHAVVITGCSRDEKTGHYQVQFYDENCIKTEPEKNARYYYINVEPDFSSFTFQDNNARKEGVFITPDNCDCLELYDPSKMINILTGDPFSPSTYGTNRSATETTKLFFCDGDAFRLTEENGSWLEYDGTNLAGDLEVFDYSCELNEIEDDDESGSRFALVIPSGNYTLTGIRNGIDIDFYDDKGFLSVSGNNIKSVTLSLENGITIDAPEGESCSFDAALYTESDDACGLPGLAKVSAECEGTFRLTHSEQNVAANVDGTLQNISAGAYVGTDLIEHLVEDNVANFSVDANGEVVIPTVTFSQDYLTLKPGQEYSNLEVKIVPENYNGLIYWSVENTTGGESTLVTVDPATGSITASRTETGTAYVIACLQENRDGYEQSARCRVDVVENDNGSETPIADDVGKTDESGKQVNGVKLLDTSAAVELYKTDYARIRVVPILSQNDVSTASVDDVMDLTGTGAAVTSAYFENDQVAALFDLRVVDDRTLEIIPKDPKDDTLALGQSAPKSIKGSYSSPIVVVLENQTDRPFPAGTLKLTVKKSLPSVKVAAIKLNSWLQDPKDEQKLVFTGGTVSSFEVKNADSFADWLDPDKMEDGVLLYTGAWKAKQSGKLDLLLTVEGWSIKLPVTVSVTAASTAPKLKFSPATLTLKPGTRDSASTTISFTPALFQTREVTVGEVLEGKNDVTADGVLITGYYNGKLTVRPRLVPGDGKAHTYQVFLYVDGEKSGYVTVKMLAAKTQVSLSVKASGAIDTAIPNSAIILTPSWKNFHKGSGEGVILTEIRKAAGKAKPEAITEQFSVSTDGTSYVITAKDSFVWEKGYTYTALLTGIYGEDLEAPAEVKLSIKQSAKQPSISLAIKAAGSIDVLRPETTSITVTPTVKNWFDYDLEDEQVNFSAKNGKADVTDQMGDAFAWKAEDGSFVITAKPGGTLNHSWKYSVTVTMSLDGKDYTKTAALKVVQGTAKVVQDVKAVELLKRDRYSSAVVKLTPTDPQLRIEKVELDEKSIETYKLVKLGDNRWEIHYLDFSPQNPKSGTVKLSVFLTGNRTDKPNAIVSVQVNIR